MLASSSHQIVNPVGQPGDALTVRIVKDGNNKAVLNGHSDADVDTTPENNAGF